MRRAARSTVLLSRGVLLSRAALLGLAVLLGLAACGTDGASGPAVDEDPARGAVSGSIVVSAAASLTDVFADIGDAFVAEHPGARVTFNVGSSGQLSSQILDGAPADVVAFADVAPMEALADAQLLGGEASIFARNRLVIVTKPGNPEGITGLADLADAGVVSLCAESAPCGAYAERALGAAGVTIPTDRITRGQDVRATLTAVTEGDAVAAIVYVTDAVATGDSVDRVEIPEADDVVAAYPIAVLAGSASPDVAVAFDEFVRSEAGQRILGDAGFLEP